MEAFAQSFNIAIVFIGVAIPWVMIGVLLLYGLVSFRKWRRRRTEISGDAGDGG